MNILSQAVKTYGLTVRQASSEFGISQMTLLKQKNRPHLPLLYELAVKGWLAQRARSAPVAFTARSNWQLAEKTAQLPPCENCGSPRKRASAPFHFRRHLVVKTVCKKREKHGAAVCNSPQKLFTIDTKTPILIERTRRGGRYRRSVGFVRENALCPVCNKAMWSENPKDSIYHPLLGKGRRLACYGPRENPHSPVYRFWSYRGNRLIDIRRLQFRKRWLPWEIERGKPATCKDCLDPTGQWNGELLKITNAPWKVRLSRGVETPKSYVNLQCRTCKRVYTYDRFGSIVHLPENPRGKARYAQAKEVFLQVFEQTRNMQQASKAAKVSPSTNYWWRTYDKEFKKRFNALVDRLKGKVTTGQVAANLRMIKHRVRRKVSA